MSDVMNLNEQTLYLRNKELEAQLFERAVDKDNYEERIGELEAENKALREFTHHRTACSFFAQRPCSCGLTTLLKADALTSIQGTKRTGKGGKS